jgi:hypothetical protein
MDTECSLPRDGDRLGLRGRRKERRVLLHQRRLEGVHKQREVLHLQAEVGRIVLGVLDGGWVKRVLGVDVPDGFRRHIWRSVLILDKVGGKFNEAWHQRVRHLRLAAVGVTSSRAAGFTHLYERELPVQVGGELNLAGSVK